MEQQVRPGQPPLSFLFENEGEFAAVAKEIQKPGVHSDVAAHNIVMSKCITCNSESKLHCVCKEPLYRSRKCQKTDAKLHNSLCKQAAEFSIDNGKDVNANRIRVLILHALENKVEFVWADTTDTHLEVAHPALSDFQRSQVVHAKFELLNVHVRGFKLARFLGHGILLWTLCDWEFLSSKWINRTAVSLGGPSGHTIPLYGPLVVTVFNQDIVDIEKRTIDNVQMRTPRQIVDYIQMEEDNPCVPNPGRFITWGDREPNIIQGVKINHPLEMTEMRFLGMRDILEVVCLNRSCPDEKLQWPAAIPFALSLKWVVREAKLPFLLDQKQPSACRGICHLHRTTFVVLQAGGAPLQLDHIRGLLDYVDLKSKKCKHGSIKLSRREFKTFWKRKYSFGGAPTSPYQLELSYPHSLISDDECGYDKLMTLVAERKQSVEEAIDKAEIEAWGILSTLNEMHPNDDDAVQRIFDYLAFLKKGTNMAKKLADADTEALITSKNIFNSLTKSQLSWIPLYLKNYGLRKGLLQDLRRGERTSEGGADESEDDGNHENDNGDGNDGKGREDSKDDYTWQRRLRVKRRRVLLESDDGNNDAEDEG